MNSLRQEIMDFLAANSVPQTRRDIVTKLPGRHSNSVNRMLRDMVKRGTAVEANGRYTLASPPNRKPVPSAPVTEEPNRWIEGDYAR